MVTKTAAVKSPTAQTSASKSKKSSHPPSSEMVIAAVLNLKDRNGSTLQAIKKYITASYDVNMKTQARYITKYLKSAVESGVLIQTKGKGASGSFKLSEESKAKVKVQSGGKSKKATSPKSPKTVSEKRTSKITAKPRKAKSTGQTKTDKRTVKTKVPVAVESKSKKSAAKK
ncbi:histone H1B-like [Leptopilina heterotoma]|uniref:histone H1B-like n=1 Tax=Leptopilina heterotoma TaxID=63436 RepID=UPI001CA8B0A9|nr:histone H1B-like [Leptopilina heterotoma]XP_043462984.1 histone H1B-like [Leptopilina heterotoma]